MSTDEVVSSNYYEVARWNRNFEPLGPLGGPLKARKSIKKHEFLVSETILGKRKARVFGL